MDLPHVWLDRSHLRRPDHAHPSFPPYDRQVLE